MCAPLHANGLPVSSSGAFNQTQTFASAKSRPMQTVCHFQAALIISTDFRHIGQIYNNSISISILMVDIAWLIHACMSSGFYAL